MKIALVLPAGRLWRWHALLIGELAVRGALEVRLAPSPPYPRAVRAWLRAERSLFGPRGGAVPIGPADLGVAARPYAPGEALAADKVFDLAAAAPPGSGRLRLRFDGREEETALFEALQGLDSPRLEVVDAAGTVRAASLPAIEVRDELGRSLSYVFGRLIALCMRAAQPDPSPAVSPAPKAATAGAGLGRFARHVLHTKLRAKLSGGGAQDADWRIALRRAPADEVLPSRDGFHPIALPDGVFHADPFLFERQGSLHLFVEAYPWRTRKGVIACAALDREGRPGPFQTVLEADHHLSYPQVFAYDGQVYMLPETAAARRLELYRAVDFPGRWERAAVMLEGFRIADATLLDHAGLWWLFASVAERGGATQDELFAWSAPSPMGPWTAHPRNPLVSDARAGRPGGRFVQRGQRLFRPAQDGVAGYGAGLAWMEVLELTPQTYREAEVVRWLGADFGPYTGVHSFSEAGGWQAIDLKSPRGQRP